MLPSPAHRIYKYASPRSLGRMLASTNGVSLTCSLPKEYNDPYELFLTIRFNTEPELLAFYADLIGQIVQQPTTCFSTRPDVTPMWAHYADNLRGAVLELDETRLKEEFPASVFGDIEYREDADDQLNELLRMAHGTSKFRHSRFLVDGVLSAAYFTKSTAWTYERERRMVLRDEDVVETEGIKLLQIPPRCISGVIAGPRVSDENRELLLSTAGAAGARFFEMRIGRSSPIPYFVNAEGLPHVFAGGQIILAEYYCEQCGEPVESNDICSWCSITDDMRYEAASSNPLRLLDEHGMLDEYFESSRRIDAELLSSRDDVTRRDVGQATPSDE